MNNSNVRNYKDYVEVVNGLFVIDKVMFEVGLDDPEEFTFRQGGVQVITRRLNGIFGVLPQYEPPQEFVPLTRQDIEEAVNHVFRPREQDYRIYIDPSTAQELERFEEDLERHRERNRIENERTWADIRNMSEEELINHFDRISQEEEN